LRKAGLDKLASEASIGLGDKKRRENMFFALCFLSRHSQWLSQKLYPDGNLPSDQGKTGVE